ncbi:MAG TPA: ATP-grasp domain-containing protein [Silvibacterium sp.]|nr:ATP-grasp domain-containing protein [Silvibacterium sp.]
MKNNDRPVVLFGATMWWPLSARLATAFIRHGCRVLAVCPTGHPLRFVRGVERLYPYDGFDSIGALKKAIAAARPDLIVPCDDGVVWQLHSLRASSPELRPLIEYSLGPPEMYSIISSRGAMLQAASELGIRIAATQALASEDELGDWCTAAPAVLKLDGTWGGKGVEIAHSPVEALESFRRLATPLAAGLAWKRFLINRDVLAVWSWRNRETPRITVQQFIQGHPANTMFACWQGEVLSIVTVEVICAQGATGAATVVRLIQNAEIAEAARLLARRLMLSGFHGLDFVLESGTGAAYLIEMNPRCTQLGHLRLPDQGDLAGVLIAKLRGEDPPAQDDPITGNTIAFFPQAFSWNPQNPYLHRGYHDVPWEEPGLLRELLRQSWPERQWRARLYHSFRPPPQEEEVNFDTVLPEHVDQSCQS